MTARSRFVEELKKAVHGRGMTYAKLGSALRLSEASVKRMFSRGTFTLERIEQILGVLDLDLHDVARMCRVSAGEGALTHDQEAALAKDERLFSVFWLLLNDWTFGNMAEALA